MTDLGRNLAVSEPLMQIGLGVAKVGQMAQSAVDAGRQMLTAKLAAKKAPARDINLPNQSGRVDRRLRRKVTR